MYIDELNQNPDATLKTSVDIVEKRIKSLKKRNIPDRMRKLLKILNRCESGLLNGHLSTAGLVLSAFPNEMESLEYGLINGHAKQGILETACLHFRINKRKNI